MGDISVNFSRWEFRDRRTGEAPPVDPALVEVLERLRATDGKPLRILSGYRSFLTNLRAGGRPRSKHRLRPVRAADVEGGRFTVAEALAAGARGVGVRRGYVVHVDTRGGGVVVFPDP